MKKILSSILIGLLVLLQSPLPVLADEVSPDVVPVVTESPAPTPEPSPIPSPVVSPSPSPAPTPAVVEPAPSDIDINPPKSKPRYVFDPVAAKWVAAQLETFYWDSTDNAWLSHLYDYNPRTGWYYLKSASVATPVSSPNDSLLTGVDPNASTADILSALFGGNYNDPLISGTGAGSVNNASVANSNNALINLLGQATVNNNTTSSAQSGNATATDSTNVGDMTTGAANALVTLLNMINSGWSWASGGLNYFMKNIMGDQTGDLNLAAPSATGGGGMLGCFMCSPNTYNGNQNTGADSINNASTTNHNGLTINNQSQGTINNNVDVLAQSGDATIARSTGGDNASTGDATAEVNILNLINSAIAANQSFFGLINILGDFNGDILFPDGFLDGAMGGNPTAVGGNSVVNNIGTGEGSTNNASSTNTNDATIINSPTATFNNNIQLAAESGDASILRSTNAGEASTGSASTSNNVANLFNNDVSGDNAVLVLVNVMGMWMGKIMNLGGGGGTQSALLTGNAMVENRDTGAGSTNNASNTNDNDLTIINSPTMTINNNIRAGAISGDATIDSSTGAGGASTGDAKVASNTANIMNSSLNLRKWFGVLVINVFGNWTGDVNNDTAAGGFSTAGVGGGSLATTVGPTKSAAAAMTQVVGGSSTASAGTGGGTVTNTAKSNTDAQVHVAGSKRIVRANAAQEKNPMGTALMIGAVLCMLAAAVMFGLEKRLKAQR